MTSVVLALAVLAIGALASVMTPLGQAARLRIGLAAAGLAGALCVIAAWGALGHGTMGRMSVEWALPLGFARLAVDGLSAWFLLVIGLVSTGTSIYSWGYFGDAKSHGPVGPYAPLVCAMITAMILVVCASDVVLFLVGWELMSLSAFFLVGFHDEDAEARRGAWTYLVATHLGTALGVLPVFAVFVARTKDTAMGGFAGAFNASEVTWCAVIFALGVVGFGTKAGFMPFHVWLPAAHPVAPSPVSALMSGVVIKTGIYGLLRLLTWLPALPIGCAIGLMIVAMLTGVVGILYAMGQRQVKRMLAYSSVENIGIIGLSISVAMLGRSLQQPVLIAFGLGGAMLHVLNHALFKGLLFLSAGAALHDAGTGDMERLGGVAHHTPVNALAFLIGSVAICALPPLNGFVSEFVVYAGLLHGVVALPSAYATLLASCAAVLALIGGLALVVFSKTFSVVFLGSQRDRSIVVHQTPRSMNAGMLFLMAACVAAAIGAGVLVPALAAAIEPFAASTVGEAEELGESLGLISPILPPLVALIVIAVGLLTLRRRMTSGAAVGGAGGTWGCGYALPETTMQYTGSSYAWTMIQSCRHLIRSKRRAPTLVGCFPPHDRLSTVTTDLAQDRIYRPVFTGLARMFERLWPLQHGRIQLYLVYIVATVLIVFLVEGWSTRLLPRESDAMTRPAISSMPDVRVESAVGDGSEHP